MRRLLTTLVATSWCVMGQQASAERWTHFGLRPLGMGNAFVAVADDFNALFYNPAGLTRMPDWGGDFFNPALSVSSDATDFVSEALNTKTDTASDILDLVEANTGKDLFGSLQWTPHLVTRSFGFGLGAYAEANAAWHRQISVDFRTVLDVVAPISYATNFLDDRLSLGLTLKARAKLGVDDEFNLDDIKSLSNDSNDGSPKLDDYLFAGQGFGGDIGLLFSPEDTFNTTLGLVVTDVGGTPLKKLPDAGELAGAPDLVLPSVSVGLSMTPWQAGGWKLTTSADMQSINQDTSSSKKLALGAELGYKKLLRLQAGLYQGYLTGGLHTDLSLFGKSLFSLSLISYAIEQGAYAGSDQARRYAAQIKILL